MGRNASLVMFDPHLKIEEQFRLGLSHAGLGGVFKDCFNNQSRVHFSSAMAIKSSPSQPGAFRIIDPCP